MMLDLTQQRPPHPIPLYHLESNNTYTYIEGYHMVYQGYHHRWLLSGLFYMEYTHMELLGVTWVNISFTTLISSSLRVG